LLCFVQFATVTKKVVGVFVRFRASPQVQAIVPRAGSSALLPSGHAGILDSRRTRLRQQGETWELQ
jgi:hypothetical protein